MSWVRARERSSIDPSRELGQYFDVARNHGWTMTHVLDTHLHADHLSGARELAAESGAALWLNPGDPFRFPYEPLVDGQSIELSPVLTYESRRSACPGTPRVRRCTNLTSRRSLPETRFS